MMTFWPSTNPASRKPWRNADTSSADSPGARAPTNPITGVADCCARAASGHAVAEPTIPLTKSRRRIAFAQGLGLRRLRLTMMQLQQGFAIGEMGFRGQ